MITSNITWFSTKLGYERRNHSIKFIRILNNVDDFHAQVKHGRAWGIRVLLVEDGPYFGPKFHFKLWNLHLKYNIHKITHTWNQWKVEKSVTY